MQQRRAQIAASIKLLYEWHSIRSDDSAYCLPICLQLLLLLLSYCCTNIDGLIMSHIITLYLVGDAHSNTTTDRQCHHTTPGHQEHTSPVAQGCPRGKTCFSEENEKPHTLWHYRQQAMAPTLPWTKHAVHVNIPSSCVSSPDA